MYLDDFLILISDLHPNFQFFYQNKKEADCKMKLDTSV